jgi:uncharacterized phiE125 gp8 family phage protein
MSYGCGCEAPWPWWHVARHMPPRWSVQVSTPPAAEPLTVDELLTYARILTGDEEPTLLAGVIAAARQQVEQDTGLALLTQTQECYLDVLAPAGLWSSAAWWALDLPWPPLQRVDRVEWTDVANVVHPVDPATYVVDAVSRPGRLIWTTGAGWPSGVRSFQGWHVQQVVGWPDPAALPPLLKHAVGLLAAHLLTTGRDLASDTPMTLMPMSYTQAIAPFRLETLA